MLNRSLNVLITRPEQKGLLLSVKLAQLSIKNQCQPLFDYQAFATEQQTKASVQHAHIVIFVSVAAVEFANKSWPISQWPFQHVIAVGKATGAALEEKNIKNVQIPSIENSEGVLLLPVLNTDANHDLNQCHITIVRGQGGRELLATELKKRKAKVTYLESYQRVWRTLSKETVKNWQEQQINCIVVTSNELLQRLTDIMLVSDRGNVDSDNLENGTVKNSADYWKQQCTWCVVSERIATLATSLGIKNIKVSEGASDRSITSALQQIWKIK